MVADTLLITDHIRWKSVDGRYSRGIGYVCPEHRFIMSILTWDLSNNSSDGERSEQNEASVIPLPPFFGNTAEIMFQAINYNMTSKVGFLLRILQ
jgi:hypothetical protein